jgi:hypothetical protein
MRRIMFNWKRYLFPATVVFVGIILAVATLGVNDAGKRTVIQTPGGELSVKFDPGVYFTWFGKTWEYNDFITFDYDRDTAGSGTTLDQAGIGVRYQDGGMGTIYGKSRYALPGDGKTMLELHKAFRSNAGVANKLIKPVTEEAMNLTAGLMRSEEGYATKRAIFTELAKAQIAKGKFVTRIKTITVTDPVTEKTVKTEIPEIVEKGNIRQHVPSDLSKFGVTLETLQLNDPGFEESTMKQITEKRKATMDIITAKANAEKAKQTAITAEEQGKANVMTARYKEEVIKEQAVVVAQRVKEVAIIAADQKVEVAKAAKLEAKEMKLRAAEVKQEQILLGQGEAERKRLVMEADGALQQKLDAYIKVNETYAKQFGKQKWVPEIQIGSTGEGDGNYANALIQMLTATTAKQIALDAKIVDNAK